MRLTPLRLTAMLDGCRKLESARAGLYLRRRRRTLLVGVVLAGAAVLSLNQRVRQQSRRETEQQFRQVLADLVRGDAQGVDSLLKQLAVDPAHDVELKLLRGAAQFQAGHPHEARRDLF